ncbi:MAG: Major facilitator superfamily [Microgenomates group bacterium GW2011_GWA2_44_7]|uniref:Major facilitator superfamily n=1 Tax=Candidatus Woesebacteria bacterium GW2011_GWA1_43_12 TaxID=1618557 RepID=A0A0G1CXP4_9BACT|nr:MAG: Major facilitator superfamily [Candidatus Woesebacteria bacterium GW2011_GWA1_43_12]KKT75890.1 MAG: Major facilitator superfamily [Microgenomates group bacterium GW2011_GWA2_44_7]KKT78490.1 MAG: Major facilitator superfamily [Microgenomates group bacterium GW2011_GWB1_44_8]
MSPEFNQLFKNANFLRLWFSQIASQVTINMVNFALIARIFENTGSSVAVSFLWITYGLPALLIGPIVGPLIDLASKRKILIVTNLLQAVAIFSYHLFKQKLFPLYTIVFVYSLLDQFYMPAEGASIPYHVPKKLLPVANSLYSLTFQAALLFGFALSGPLIVAFGADMPFVLGSILLILAALSVYKLPKKENGQRHRSFGAYWQDLTYGYSYVRHQPFILFPIILIMGFQTGFSIIAVIFPSYINDVLHLAIRDASWVLVIPGGIGALLAAFYILPKVLGSVRKIKVIELGLLAACACLLSLGIVVPTLGGIVRSGVASLSAVLGGIAGILLLVPANTVIQEQTPPSMRGRIYGSLTFLLTIAVVAPTLLAATISDVVGAQMLVLILATGALISFFLIKTKGEGFVNYHLNTLKKGEN